MRRMLVVNAMIGVVFGAIALSSVGATFGARESITVNLGDTITPRFTIQTDTVLRVAGTRIVARACGSSFIYLRTWKGAGQLSADTIAVTVRCPIDPQKVSTVSLYTGFIRDSLDRAIGIWDSTLTIGATRCVYVVTRNGFGQVLTGKTFSLSSSDTLVARIGGSAPITCPDTSVDPERMIPFAARRS